MAHRTITGRAWCLRKFVVWARELGVRSPAGLTSSLLEDYRRHRVQAVNARGRRDGSHTVNLHLTSMRDFLRVLAAKGAVPASLREAVGPIKEPKLLPKVALSHEEVMAVMQKIPGTSAVQLRDRAMLEVLYATGVRRQELVDAKLTDVDLAGGVLRIECGKGSKGRIVPLGRAAVEWLGRYLQAARPALMGRGEDPGWLFVSKSGAKLNGNVVREVVRRWAKAAGITKEVSPHTLRRSCATGMVRNRANLAHVRDLLGHEDFGSLHAYVRLEITDLKDAHRRFHPREREEDGGDAGGAVTR
jgi:site-specific recombinase XerD